ncbi:MFS transporter [Campylobacter sp. Cr9]|uniref:MFS transporter n=1 Tax=unclassified Campylobacter TaxID=2593542 RepID=UPI001EFBBAF2|nr:MFS transporter [Campylobacter sp. RM5004]MBZ7985456.1 MFS transporter [Campylobacter sp. Cr9]ULO00967.1 major facilitator superfamily transporter [Campylobacter sp. RM5004]
MFKNYTKRQVAIITSSALGMCLEMMDIMFIAYALSSIMNEFNLSGKEAGFISTATNLAMLAGGLIFGFLADRYGKIKVFSYSIIFFAVGTGLIFFANTYYWLILFRVLAGLGAGGEYGIGMSLIKDEFGNKNMGKYSSIIAIFGQIGAAMAAILAGMLLAFGWRYLFLIGLVPVILAVVIRLKLDEAPIQKSSKQEFLKAFKSNIYLSIALSIMASIQIAGYFGMMNWLPKMAQTSLNLTSSSASYWMVSTIFGMSVGMWVFGKFFDRFGPRLSYAVFLLGSAALVFSFGLVSNYTELLIIGFIIGFFSNGMFAGYGALVNILYPANVSSSANNLIINTGRAVGGFSSVIIGILLDLYGSVVVVMGFLSALYLISFCIMLSLKELKYDKFLQLKEKN